MEDKEMNLEALGFDSMEVDIPEVVQEESTEAEI